jgi:hypothetical protein
MLTLVTLGWIPRLNVTEAFNTPSNPGKVNCP